MAETQLLYAKPSMLLTRYGLLKSFLPVLMLAAFVSVSCGGGTDYEPPPECDLSSQINEQRLSGKERKNYYPRVFSRDFSRDFGADISPTENDYDTARKVSRSVFEIEFFEKGDTKYSTGGGGTGWLIAPGYVVTAAHNLRDPKARIDVHTFDGDTIRAEIVYIDPDREDATDLAVLRLEREIDAVPMKIADARPERNEFLMAMGWGSVLRGLGGWTVSAGPALELRSGEPEPAPYPGRVYHVVPTAPGMSGGPIFNRRGEVVSIVSTGQRSSASRFVGVMPFDVPTQPPENLWLYGFDQAPPSHFSYGPNPDELNQLYDEISGLVEPENAGSHRDGSRWGMHHEVGNEVGNEFGDKYSPFPLDRFDQMEHVYKQARKAAVTVIVDPSGKSLYGSGFIYDENTVITVGHVAPEERDRADIVTEKGEGYGGTVLKTQNQGFGKCDIAIIKMDTPGVLSGYPTLRIGDSSSLRCGDPLVAIGSAELYNSVGPLQGVGAVYMLSRKYTSEFLAHSLAPGMSGGPVVNGEGKVVSLSSASPGRAQDKWLEPGPLIIRTRLPVYLKQDFSEGPNAEMIRRFIENKEFYCE